MGEVVQIVQKVESTFAQFWKVWPKRDGKLDAQKAFGQLSFEDQLAAIEAVPNHIAQWVIDNVRRKFIPLPASWIRGRRWEDELECRLPQAQPCYWSGCKSAGSHQRGSGTYCEQHVQMLNRGLTPPR